MSSIFRDPKYEQMLDSEDAWLELAIEPFHFIPNDILGAMPETIDVTEHLISCLESEANGSSSGLNYTLQHPLKTIIDSTIKTKIADQANYPVLTNRRHGIIKLIANVYTWEIDGDLDWYPADSELSGKVLIKKKKHSFNDDEIRDCLHDFIKTYLYDIRRSRRYHGQSTASRANELLDLLEVKDTKSLKNSIKRKHGAIADKVVSIIMNDEWKLRTDKLVMQFASDVLEYLHEANELALMRLIRLKCMKHRGNPIYSMEEIV